MKEKKTVTKITTTHTHLDTHNVKLKFFSFLCSGNSITFFYLLFCLMVFDLFSIERCGSSSKWPKRYICSLWMHPIQQGQYCLYVCVWPCWKHTQATKVIIIIMNGKFFFLKKKEFGLILFQLINMRQWDKMKIKIKR